MAPFLRTAGSRKSTALIFSSLLTYTPPLIPQLLSCMSLPIYLLGHKCIEMYRYGRLEDITASYFSLSSCISAFQAQVYCCFRTPRPSVHLPHGLYKASALSDKASWSTKRTFRAWGFPLQNMKRETVDRPSPDRVGQQIRHRLLFRRR